MYSPGNYSGNSHWNGDDTVVSTAFQIEFCVTHIDRSVDVVGKLYAQQKVLEISFRMGFRLNAFVAKGTLGNSEFEGIVYPEKYSEKENMYGNVIASLHSLDGSSFCLNSEPITTGYHVRFIFEDIHGVKYGNVDLYNLNDRTAMASVVGLKNR